MTDGSYLKKLADMQTQIKELVPDSLKENGEKRMNWCREGVPCVYATINGYCTLTACMKNGRLLFPLPFGPGANVEITEECTSTGVIKRITYECGGKKEVIWDSTMGMPEPQLEHSAFGFRVVFPAENLEPGCQLNELFAGSVTDAQPGSE